MYLPSVTSGRIAARYQVGDYTAVVVTDCTSSGLVQYAHVLYVYGPNDETPIFAVAAEISAGVEQSGHSDGGLFLGVFPGDGHLNLGLSPEWADLERFTQRALDIVREHFDISAAPQALSGDSDDESSTNA